MSNIVILILAIIVCVGAYIMAVVMMPKRDRAHLKTAMERLEQQKVIDRPTQEESRGRRRRNVQNNLLVRAFLALPFVDPDMEMIERAGLLDYMDRVIMAGAGICLLLLMVLIPYGPIAFICAPVFAFLAVYVFVKMKGARRRKRFLDLFPDALDIIVRSVKAGYPINTAIGMVADSMPEEVGYEYLRVMNETAYGYTLSEAVHRFAERMDEPDVSFFSVVISVQQETGGNLAEVLGNLSNVIRQRKHLRLKVKALSAEGRMTVWILVGIAFFMIGAVYVFSPAHFNPLLHTPAGHKVVMVVASMFTLAYFSIRKIINFKI